MKSFFEDYFEMVWKQQFEFIKMHWLGFTVLCAVGGVASVVCTYPEQFKEKVALITDKIRRK